MFANAVVVGIDYHEILLEVPTFKTFSARLPYIFDTLEKIKFD